MMYSFIVDHKYFRKDVFRMVGLPEEIHGGSWYTGMVFFRGDHFIFCNVGTAGRTGHDYRNSMDGGLLTWYARNGLRLSNASIQMLLYPVGDIYIFYRNDSRDPFTFAGLGSCEEAYDSRPVRIVWSLLPAVESVGNGDSVVEFAHLVREGLRTTVTVNRYERSSFARRRCIDRWGVNCAVCSFDFGRVYGELGRDFIHVHHLKELSSIGKEYVLDADNDLRPVCPNCHAMLHREVPALTIERLKTAIEENRGKG